MNLNGHKGNTSLLGIFLAAVAAAVCAAVDMILKEE